MRLTHHCYLLYTLHQGLDCPRNGIGLLVPLQLVLTNFFTYGEVNTQKLVTGAPNNSVAATQRSGYVNSMPLIGTFPFVLY